MEPAVTKSPWKFLEAPVLVAGFLAAGIVIAVVAVSYVMNSPFPHRWLVWIIGGAFGAVALLALEWPRGLRHPGEAAKGKLRLFLLLAMPVAFILSSQICGPGLKACTSLCHVINFSLIVVAAVVAYLFARGPSASLALVPLVIIAVLPHCVCPAPINILWRHLASGSPTCEVMPMAAVVFAGSALRGVRPRLGAVVVAVLLGTIVFVAAGNALVGFPWEGCVR